MKQFLSALALLALLTISVWAQDATEAIKVRTVADKMQVEMTQAIGGSIIFEAKVVKGAPYSATAESETIQMLMDGNRIRNKTTTMVYRDSEGRTRREITGKAPGAPLQVFINDPVNNTTYSLNPKQLTATKSPATAQFTVVTKATGDQEAKSKTFDTTVTVNVQSDKTQLDDSQRALMEDKLRRAKEEAPTGGKGVAVGYAVKPSDIAIARSEKSATKESLGQQMIEGVMCEGARRTITIAADTIGNDLPINIVTEEWYSPELQALVLTKRTDPRNGETIYRLTNINRSEPARALFEVPADYTIQEPARPVMMKRMKEEQ